MQDLNENDNESGKVNGNEDEKSNKDKILSRSRRENKNGDEREKQVYLNGSRIAAITFLLCGVILFITEFFVNKVFRYDYCAMACVTALVAHIYEAKKIKKASHIIFAILCVVYSALFITLYILSLCGKI